MKGATCNLIARTDNPHKAYGRHRAKGTVRKIDTIFCAVSNGIIETSYIKPGKTLLRLLQACWQLISAPTARKADKRHFHY